MQRPQPPKNESVLQLRNTMTYNTLDDGSLQGGSLHGGSLHGGSMHGDDIYSDLNDIDVDVEGKRAAFGKRTEKDVSMDLNDLLQDMGEEREESGSSSSDSVSLALDIGDVSSPLASPERIGSKLALDDMPSESKGLDWGSVNWGSFMGSFRGSFRKRSHGSSRRLILRRKSSKKIVKNDEPETSQKRRKSVRFFRFDTIIPSHESMRRRFSSPN